jgi:hypothetical protein
LVECSEHGEAGPDYMLTEVACGWRDRRQNCVTRFQLICPSGRLGILFPAFVQPFLKNILFFRNGKSVHILCYPVSEKGRLEIVTDARRDAMDAGALQDGRR